MKSSIDGWLWVNLGGSWTVFVFTFFILSGFSLFSSKLASMKPRLWSSPGSRLVVEFSRQELLRPRLLPALKCWVSWSCFSDKEELISWKPLESDMSEEFFNSEESSSLIPSNLSLSPFRHMPFDVDNLSILDSSLPVPTIKFSALFRFWSVLQPLSPLAFLLQLLLLFLKSSPLLAITATSALSVTISDNLKVDFFDKFSPSTSTDF